jgi:hypothetical protein
VCRQPGALEPASRGVTAVWVCSTLSALRVAPAVQLVVLHTRVASMSARPHACLLGSGWVSAARLSASASAAAAEAQRCCNQVRGSCAAPCGRCGDGVVLCLLCLGSGAQLHPRERAGHHAASGPCGLGRERCSAFCSRRGAARDRHRGARTPPPTAIRSCRVLGLGWKASPDPTKPGQPARVLLSREALKTFGHRDDGERSQDPSPRTRAGPQDPRSARSPDSVGLNATRRRCSYCNSRASSVLSPSGSTR